LHRPCFEPAGKQVVCALQTHQPALAEAVGQFNGTEEAEVPMLRFKVRPDSSTQPQC
jgi:hypothetical protein